MNKQRKQKILLATLKEGLGSLSKRSTPLYQPDPCGEIDTDFSPRQGDNNILISKTIACVSYDLISWQALVLGCLDDEPLVVVADGVGCNSGGVKIRVLDIHFTEWSSASGRFPTRFGQSWTS